MKQLFWFRQDLRINDNAALKAAAQGSELYPVYCFDEHSPDITPAGAWWLFESLKLLKANLQALGSDLIVLKGAPHKTLMAFVKKHKIEAVHCNYIYTPDSQANDEELTASLDAAGVGFHPLHGQVLIPPGKIQNKQGQIYRVFSGFARELMSVYQDYPPLPRLKQLPGLAKTAQAACTLDKLSPKYEALGPDYSEWQPGEKGARAQCKKFLKSHLRNYGRDRSRVDLAGSSSLSPHLHWGEISIRELWHLAAKQAGHDSFLRELAWREFSYHTLVHIPSLPDKPLKAEFEKFPWVKNKAHLKAWQEGLTGYPLVDAGMRQLRDSGWMHNRARMNCASFLIKHLRLSWQSGAAWYWERLVDGDAANNSINWQWVAGCGVDSAPFFRIFNPVTQAKDYDPKGDYIRRWLPELKHLQVPHIFAPWQAPEDVLADAGIKLGQDYPKPIVEHTEARRLALEGFESIKAKS